MKVGAALASAFAEVEQADDVHMSHLNSRFTGTLTHQDLFMTSWRSDKRGAIFGLLPTSKNSCVKSNTLVLIEDHSEWMLNSIGIGIIFKAIIISHKSTP